MRESDVVEAGARWYGIAHFNAAPTPDQTNELK